MNAGLRRHDSPTLWVLDTNIQLLSLSFSEFIDGFG